MLTVWALDDRHIRRGMLQPVAAKAVLREMDVDTFLIEVDLSSPLADRINLDWSLILDDGLVRTSGIITEIETRIEATTSTLAIHGVGELHRLADRLIYPNPAQDADKQTRARYKDKGPAETVIKRLVDVSAGPAALPARRSRGLTVPASQNTGSPVTVNERFSNLLEETRSLAYLGGVTFSAVRTDEGVVPLVVRSPRDLSRQIRITAETGGASTGVVGLVAATVTAAVAAGQGEGAERFITELSRPASRRIEVLKDRRDADEADTVIQAAQKLLADGEESGKATIKITETLQRRLGEHFLLGDTISVQIGALTVSKPVRAAEITWDGYGREVELTVGNIEETSNKTPGWVKEVKRLDSRIRGLETR